MPPKNNYELSAPYTPGITIIALVDCILGILIVGWFFKTPSNLVNLYNAILSSCPCSIVAKIAICVVFLMIVLLIKTGIQIFQLNAKARNDHINLSSLGICVLLLPVFFLYKEGIFSSTAVICELSIAYLAWSIIYLNSFKIRELFKI